MSARAKEPSMTSEMQLEFAFEQYIYDGRELVAVLEHRADGWHVTIGNREIGVCADRVAALRLVDNHAMKKGPSHV